MADAAMNSPEPGDALATTLACEHDVDCCHGETHDEAHPQQPDPIPATLTDGAGEPCPAPLMWQEICENYYRESVPWEITRGSDLITGRTWGCGKPLYLLNNFAATAELYALVAWLLRDEFRCVVFDVTTPDRSSARRNRPTMQDFASDLFSVADAQGDSRFSLFGAGFGAAVALQATLDQPARIDGLILQHGFAKRRLSFFERLLTALCRRSRLSLDRLPQRRRFQAVNHQPWFPPYDHSRFEFLVESTGQLPLCDLARRAMAVNQFDVTNRLHEIHCPVMLLRTEGEGRKASESQSELEKLMDHPRVEWMHSAGQHPYLSHPHRVAKVIRSFFQLPTDANSTKG